jgi:hypothetical protein
MYLLAWSIQRFEKPEALDMIHMKVGEQEVDARYLRP